MANSLKDWTLGKIEAVKESPCVLVRDPLRVVSDADGDLHRFARANGYTVIVAATNLVFRELYEQAIADPEVTKLLVIDQAPAGRRSGSSAMKAPPLFYPDLLARTPGDARIDVDLRQFLRDATGDPDWPQETNDPRYARLIRRHLDAALAAHRNLRAAHQNRFTDHDLKTIVAFAALGVGDSAFKKLDAKDYWKIGLLGHEALEELDSLAPEVTKPIKDVLSKAPPPFCWFADRDPEIIIRAFYLSVILAQHFENWSLLLANIDPSLATMAGVATDLLWKSANDLIALSRDQAERDLKNLEQSLDQKSLQFLLFDQMKIATPEGFAAAIEKERYSTLVRSSALLMALEDLLSTKPAVATHARLADILAPEGDKGEATFVDTRSSIAWSQLKQAYQLATSVQPIREALAVAVKILKVVKTEQLSFKYFSEIWNVKKINRLEYYLSALERLIDSGDLLPRAAEDMPSALSNALARMKQRIRAINAEVQGQLDEVNGRYQEMVAVQYPRWVGEKGKGEKGGKEEDAPSSLSHLLASPVLTSQFIRRCLKPHWDPQKEKAVIFIFDGMRYDIWDEMLKPMLLDRMDVVVEVPASSLLPTETHITRKAICAGANPDQFDSRSGEDKLLKEALEREFNYSGKVEVVAPEGAGTGETVRYRAGNLDVYIFELCDKELHKVQIRTLPDGREAPSRSLAFIYQQHLKNIVDTEVMAIVRRLAAGTKVFVTADHGFSRVGRQPLWFDEDDLNEAADCSYLCCLLRAPIQEANLPARVRDNIIAFAPAQLRMPNKESRTSVKTGSVVQKEFRSIVFPRTGYSFRRQGSHYNPDAYSHGGISIPEMMIPMAVLQVRAREEGLLTLGAIAGPREVVQGEEAEFRVQLHRTSFGGLGPDEIRIDVEASYSSDPERFPLPRQVLYVPPQGVEIVYRFRPDPADATDDERRKGEMERTLSLAISYREGRRTTRKSQTHRFSVRLNPEQLVRRLGNHGNILGLTPKSMR